MLINNANDLRVQLSAVFEDLRAGKISVDEADSFANLGGKIIGSAVAQVKYNEMRNSSTVIEFLEDGVKGVKAIDFDANS